MGIYNSPCQLPLKRSWLSAKCTVFSHWQTSSPPHLSTIIQRENKEKLLKHTDYEQTSFSHQMAYPFIVHPQSIRQKRPSQVRSYFILHNFQKLFLLPSIHIYKVFSCCYCVGISFKYNIAYFFIWINVSALVLHASHLRLSVLFMLDLSVQLSG